MNFLRSWVVIPATPAARGREAVGRCFSGGFIRFVGGPWHNRHKPMFRWEARLYSQNTILGPPPGQYGYVCYELVQMRTRLGTPFFEYHATEPSQLPDTSQVL